MAETFDEVDLEDEWEERQQPPTLKFSTHGSMSGSVNILSDTTQKWTNVNDLVSKDLLTKQKKTLTALFEPPSPTQNQATEGLSMVVEETTEALNSADGRDRYRRDRYRLKDLKPEGEVYGDETTVQATVRSADGLIPNFSFPRVSSAGAVQPPIIKDSYISKENHIDPVMDKELVENGRTTQSRSEEDAEQSCTPKRNTHKSSASSVSPTKSPLKLFHAEQDTFTRDHTARMIGMLSAAPAPAMQTLQVDSRNVQRPIQEADISDLTMISDSGPNRKKVKTHEPKGSVTLQNFNENADRLAAKLRAKGGGLGKGLPKVVEDNTVVLGRRVSSAAERLDHQRKKERSSRCPPSQLASSGFEALNISIDHFAAEPKFGTRSSKSHFSDWESDANDQSRHVSRAAAPSSNNDVEDLGQQQIRPQAIYDSIRQTWTKTPGRITGTNRPSSSPAQESPRQVHRRAASSTSIPSPKKSPRYKNFPPAAVETVRHGDMIFDTKQQCWRHVSDTKIENDANYEVVNPHPISSSSSSREKRCSLSRSDYPDELDISTSTSSRSGKEQPPAEKHMSMREHYVDEHTGSRNSLISDQSLIIDDPSMVRHRSPPRMRSIDLVKVSQNVVDARDESCVDDLADLTADMTMSYSTGYLVSAINKRYGAGPWEHIQAIDLHGLELDSLHGLAQFFPALTSLDISDNKITSLHDLPSTIEYLKAGKNKLTSHRANFKHLTNLEHLDLTSNEFEDLDSLAPLLHLRHLDVSNNHLECVDGLRNLHNLISFRAHGNVITGIDFVDIQACNTLQHIQTLDLSSNKIISVRGVESLQGLIDLDVSDNLLQAFEVSNAMPQLKILKASENQLSRVDLTMVPKVRVVYLDDNELRDVVLPRCMKHIESFSLRRQHGLGQLDINLNSLCEVQRLFLGGNTWSDFSLSAPFHSLKYLELAGLALTSLPDDFAEMTPNLRVLNLSNNDISDLSAVSGMLRLERLMLCNNKIDRVEPLAQVLSTLSRLKAIDLRANPYTSRFYAPIHPSYDIDYFAHLDGMRNTTNVMQQWLAEDDKFFATLTRTVLLRRQAYQSLLWTVCRALRWHDGRMLEAQNLLDAEEYVTSFRQGEAS